MFRNLMRFLGFTKPTPDWLWEGKDVKIRNPQGAGWVKAKVVYYVPGYPVYVESSVPDDEDETYLMVDELDILD